MHHCVVNKTNKTDNILSVFVFKGWCIMGGNAITNAKRIDKQEYMSLCSFFSEKLRDLDVIFNIIVAYESKESFGDMDILIQSHPTIDLKTLIQSSFDFKEIVPNGNVISCNYHDFQIDFIFENEANFEFSRQYYSYNDLGNLIGRISHKHGFKFGHDGLWYCMRDQTHMFGEICLTKDFKTAIEFLGFSYDRYLQGFKDLTEIFEYVVNSPYFNRDLYPLEHRNHYARMRDRKRKTYTAFLQYCDNLPWDVDYVYYDKEVYLQRAFSLFPDFKRDYERTREEYFTTQSAKQKFNGVLVGEWTGLKGKELGHFLAYMKQDFDEISGSWLTHVLNHNLDEIKTRTMVHFNFADWR